MKTKLKLLDKAKIDTVIGMAWDDRCSFERIEKGFGLVEKEVIETEGEGGVGGTVGSWADAQSEHSRSRTAGLTAQAADKRFEGRVGVEV